MPHHRRQREPDVVIVEVVGDREGDQVALAGHQPRGEVGVDARGQRRRRAGVVRSVRTSSSRRISYARARRRESTGKIDSSQETLPVSSPSPSRDSSGATTRSHPYNGEMSP